MRREKPVDLATPAMRKDERCNSGMEEFATDCQQCSIYFARTWGTYSNHRGCCVSTVVVHVVHNVAIVVTVRVIAMVADLETFCDVSADLEAFLDSVVELEAVIDDLGAPEAFFDHDRAVEARSFPFSSEALTSLVEELAIDQNSTLFVVVEGPLTDDSHTHCRISGGLSRTCWWPGLGPCAFGLSDGAGVGVRESDSLLFCAAISADCSIQKSRASSRKAVAWNRSAAYAYCCRWSGRGVSHQ